MRILHCKECQKRGYRNEAVAFRGTIPSTINEEGEGFCEEHARREGFPETAIQQGLKIIEERKKKNKGRTPHEWLKKVAKHIETSDMAAELDSDYLYRIAEELEERHEGGWKLEVED